MRPWTRANSFCAAFEADRDRRLRGARQRLGDRQRILRRLDQLHAQREARLAHHPPHPVELVLVAAVFAQPHPCGEFLDRAGQVERGGVDQRVEQIGPPRERIGERRGEREDADELRRAARAALPAGEKG